MLFFIIMIILLSSLLYRPRYYDPWYAPRFGFFGHHRPMGYRQMGGMHGPMNCGMNRGPVGGMHNGHMGGHMGGSGGRR